MRTFYDGGTGYVNFYTKAQPQSTEVIALSLPGNGNVGIGRAPNYKFDVSATSDTVIAMNNSASVTSGNRGNIVMYNSADTTVGLIRFGAVTDNVGTDIQFYTRPAAGSLAQNMILSSVGNLNILNGSLAVGYSGVPAATLDLRGSGVVSQYMISSSGSAQQNQIVSLFNSGGGYSPLNIDGSVVQFKTSGSIKATVSSTGLDVTGTLSATSNVSTTGNLTVGSSGNGDQAMTTLQGYAPNAANGSYGRLLFSANTNATGGARRYLLTNALDYASFAIICSVDANTTPTLDASGAVSSGTAAFIIKNNATAIFNSVVSVGNATPANSGAGITFPATQSASSNANTLDDYEEGTWNPRLFSDATEGTSYTSQTGYYVKVGRLVTCWFGVACTLVGGTYLRFGNLPYSVGTSGTGYQSVAYANGSGGQSSVYIETYLGINGQVLQSPTGYVSPASFSGVFVGGVYQFYADA
jgi:hypothetical protein